MTLTRLLVAATAVAAWFIGWGWTMMRTGLAAGRGRPAVEAAEAVFLTMFASLWFASLGHGGWWVLFGVVALLVEGPVRLRHRAGLAAGAEPWRPVVLGVIRWMGAAAILALLL